MAVVIYNRTRNIKFINLKNKPPKIETLKKTQLDGGSFGSL
jgi:hypothetical protein